MLILENVNLLSVCAYKPSKFEPRV